MGKIDQEGVRLDQKADRRYVSSGKGRDNFKIGKRALFLLKDLTGVTAYKRRKNLKERWHNFRDERRQRNNTRDLP